MYTKWTLKQLNQLLSLNKQTAVFRLQAVVCVLMSEHQQTWLHIQWVSQLLNKHYWFFKRFFTTPSLFSVSWDVSSELQLSGLQRSSQWCCRTSKMIVNILIKRLNVQKNKLLLSVKNTFATAGETAAYCLCLCLLCLCFWIVISFVSLFDVLKKQ